MKKSTINYAMEELRIVQNDNDCKFFTSKGEVYIELASGRNLKIDSEEIKYQAEKHLHNIKDETVTAAKEQLKRQIKNL